jgi:hypothetical protein
MINTPVCVVGTSKGDKSIMNQGFSYVFEGCFIIIIIIINSE